MIREAVVEDIIKIIPLVEKFASEIGEYYEDKFNKRHTAAVIKNCIDYGVCYVNDVDGVITGVIAGLASGNLWNPAVKQLDEQIYYVLPEHRGGTAGLRLIRAYDKAAQRFDICTLKLMYNSPDISKHYERMGYTELERTFVRHGG